MPDLPEALQNRLKACRTLPSVPTVVLEVLDLCQDDGIGIPKVSKVLERDPALAAKVLKVANSPWYGVRSQITTLDRALALLGINATLSLALSFSFVRNLSKGQKARFDHQSYWRRSAIVGVAAREIGSWAKAGTRDELFLAGLLQDIGMLVLNETYPEQYGPFIAESKGVHLKLVEIERRNLGSDHAAVGEWMLGRWNLPENLRHAVAGSHDPNIIKGDKPDLFIRSVALASCIADIWINPQTGAATATASASSVTLLNIPEERFERLLLEIAAALPEATTNLEIDIGGEETVNRILDEAREALVVLSLQAQQKAHEFQLKSQYDRLTSLYNRAYLEEVFPQHFGMAQKLAQPLSVLFLDLDHFKKVNDSYGHQAGDQMLISVGKILRVMLRGHDVAVRYGGEEFVCLLPDTPDDKAAIVGERIRAEVAARKYPIAENLEIPLTISVGCATLSSSRQFTDTKELINAADKCLYAAKSAGRNRVVTFDMLAAPESVAQP